MTVGPILPGTLEILVMRALSDGALHGYGVLKRIEQLSEGAFLVEEGALYPALWRLEKQRLVKASWGASENNRRAKFYAVTPKGRAHLGEQIEAWDRRVAAMNLVLGERAVAR